MRTYNCARVHIGSYVGGGSNEFERQIDCGYEVVNGRVSTKELKPIKVQWTTSEYRTSLLRTIVLYPVTEEAVIEITNSRGTRRVRLVRHKKGEGRRSTIFKARV